MTGWLTGYEAAFIVKLALCLLLGTVIGVERELRNKPAGISTHCFVMAGACLFTFVSTVADPNSPARIAAQVVSGVGFLGAGMILKSENNSIRNLTTAAAVWFAAVPGEPVRNAVAHSRARGPLVPQVQLLEVQGGEAP